MGNNDFTAAELALVASAMTAIGDTLATIAAALALQEEQAHSNPKINNVKLTRYVVNFSKSSPHYTKCRFDDEFHRFIHILAIECAGISFSMSIALLFSILDKVPRLPYPQETT